MLISFRLSKVNRKCMMIQILSRLLYCMLEFTISNFMFKKAQEWSTFPNFRSVRSREFQTLHQSKETFMLYICTVVKVSISTQGFSIFTSKMATFNCYIVNGLSRTAGSVYHFYCGICRGPKQTKQR